MTNLEKARKCFDKASRLEIFGNYGEACDVYREGKEYYEKAIEEERYRKSRWKTWAKQAWELVKKVNTMLDMSKTAILNTKDNYKR